MKENKIYYIIGTLFIIMLALVLVFLYKFKTPSEVAVDSPKDFAASIASSKEMIEINSLLKSSQKGTAIEKIIAYKKTLNNPREESVVDNLLASVLISGDRAAGSEKYYEIYSNESYPAVSRSYALTMLMLDAGAFLDFSIANKILKTNSTSSDFIRYSLAQKAYELYPLPTAGWVIVDQEIKDASSSEEVKSILGKYQNKLDNDIKLISDYVGMKHLMVNTFMIKANALRKAENKGGTTEAIVMKALQDSVQQTKIDGRVDAEEFATLFFADYLIEKRQLENAKNLIINTLSDGIASEAMRENLTNQSKFEKRFPNIYKLKNEDSAIAKYFKF